MSYDIRLIKAAKQDFLKLDGSQKELVAKRFTIATFRLRQRILCYFF